MSKYVRQEKSLPKHPVASSAIPFRRPPAVPAAPKERPGWKGPGFIKKSSGSKQQTQNAASSARLDAPEQEQLLSVESQQLLLDVLRRALPICQDYELLKGILQETRVAMSNGDYEMAFSRPDCLEAYAVRWSPNRALCCANVLLEMCDRFPQEGWFEQFLGTLAPGLDDNESSASTERQTKIVCFGGGATEILTFAALLRHFRSRSPKVEAVGTDSDLLHENRMSSSRSALADLGVLLVDLADWTNVVSTLDLGLKTPPPLSKYASKKARENNCAYTSSSSISTSLRQSDIITVDQTDLNEMLGSQPLLITLFFTLDDLNNSSTAKTAAFLLKLTLAAPSGTLLLIVDKSEMPGSTAADGSGNSDKAKYSTHRLLDLVLLKDHGTGLEVKWEELVRNQSQFFKLNEALKYPVSLDNFRFQVHMFRRR